MRSSTVHVNPRSHICPDSLSVNLDYASLEFKDAQENRVVIWARNYNRDETKAESLQALGILILDAIGRAVRELESAAGAKAPDDPRTRPDAEGSPPAAEVSPLQRAQAIARHWKRCVITWTLNGEKDSLGVDQWPDPSEEEIQRELSEMAIPVSGDGGA